MQAARRKALEASALNRSRGGDARSELQADGAPRRATGDEADRRGQNVEGTVGGVDVSRGMKLEDQQLWAHLEHEPSWAERARSDTARHVQQRCAPHPHRSRAARVQR